MEPTRILIVDDEPSALELLEMYLTEKGFKVSCALDGRGCIEKIVSFKPEIVILDVRLPDADGLDLLRKVREGGDTPHIIIVTSFHDMTTTIKAIKLGAFEYIPKPIDVDDLDAAIERALELSRTRDRTDGLLITAFDDFETGDLIGKTREMKEIFKTIGILSSNRVTVLIEGETGTGKELVAKAIHYHSAYKDEPFIPINCATIVEDLLESELFGHEKGAFTGAVALQKGKFEIAGNGTILLDEISEIPFELQAKLLRFLQDKEFRRVGGDKTIRSSARVIASTNRDLLQMVKTGSFREDLYYRLGVGRIKIPALKERKADIPIIVEYLLKKINRDLHKTVERVEERALNRILDYNWPGNVRELENLLTRAVMHAQGNTILEKVVVSLLNNVESAAGNQSDVGERIQKGSNLREIEKEHILNVLRNSQWHYANACKVLGISYPTLKKKIREYGILPKPHKHNPS